MGTTRVIPSHICVLAGWQEAQALLGCQENRAPLSLCSLRAVPSLGGLSMWPFPQPFQQGSRTSYVAAQGSPNSKAEAARPSSGLGLE